MRLIDADELLNEISIMPINIGFEDVERVEQIIKDMPSSVESKPDRCDGCKNLPRFSHEEPCKSCANNYINKYER